MLLHHSLCLCTNLKMLSSLQGIFCQVLLAFHKTMDPPVYLSWLREASFYDSGVQDCVDLHTLQAKGSSGQSHVGFCAFLFLLCPPFPGFPWLFFAQGALPSILPLVSPNSSFRAQLRFSHAPSSLPPLQRIGSFHSTLRTLNNASHKFCNSNKKGQTLSDVSIWSLPPKTKLFAGVLLAPSAYLPTG